MSCKKIEFKKSAEKFIKNRSRQDQLRLLSKIYKLPEGEHIKKMKGYDNRYRLKIGDFRVIYEIYNDPSNVKNDCASLQSILHILVVDIGNRGDVYK